ncbi:beta-ketoacyl-ACP synthase III [Gilvimarinus agarilyticus]|uniref:beta-ketoacyl-ACP synthase III n=1 Tax=unclassified Gilvimarinus TaxID=2642066 RepID=UPI001C09D604|nr:MULTISPECIES: beta-ketoacyl-ACP synthase III [unclassified Gilvimarinus]MBU2885724.1 beta-ketoacyl-ACP synthase III [Gilvimarinus agarilyticus]MDO6570584.1 beta-ketoacyl-ACP synthase III [Gilvimarinus sp. 2_MG-2023]MDO6748515.1 beta-ketoacyl-ACP synthase III [Gilvimarinus sp. 1_MG-2023]
MSANTVYITHTGSFLPNEPVGNDDMEKLLGQVGARASRSRKIILRSNQIKTRYYAIDPQTGKHNYTNAELCAHAVKQALADDVPLESVTCLAAATSIPDQLMPGHAAMVHGELGSPPCEVATTSGVCVSGMTALKYAFLSVAAGVHSSAVAAASEAASYTMKADNFSPELEQRIAELEANPEIAFEKDFLRWMLSDGAGAMVLQSEKPTDKLALKVEWIDVLSYANEMTACMYAGGRKEEDGSLTGWQAVSRAEAAADSFMSVKQDVKQLNEHIMPYTAEKTLPKLRDKYGITPDQIDYFLPHYSSHYFRDRLDQCMKNADFGIDQERWFTNLPEKGNTGAASIYIMIDDLLKSGQLKRGQKLLCYIPESGRFSVSYMLLEVV